MSLIIYKYQNQYSVHIDAFHPHLTPNPRLPQVNQRSVLACTHVAQGHSKAVLSVFATDDLLFSASKGGPQGGRRCIVLGGLMEY